jgi:hypothetical protein
LDRPAAFVEHGNLHPTEVIGITGRPNDRADTCPDEIQRVDFFDCRELRRLPRALLGKLLIGPLADQLMGCRQEIGVGLVRLVEDLIRVGLEGQVVARCAHEPADHLDTVRGELPNVDVVSAVHTRDDRRWRLLTGGETVDRLCESAHPLQPPIDVLSSEPSRYAPVPADGQVHPASGVQ